MTDLKQAAMQLALDALVTCCAEEWRTLNNFGMKQVYDEKKVNAAVAALHAALAEPERKPLTDDEIAQAMFRAHAIVTGPTQFRFAREIERAHGIGEQHGS